MSYTKEFDELFEKYAPAPLNWLLIKALAIQESLLKPKARSTVNGQPGAIGIMQIMPATGRDLGFTEEELLDPEKNIKAGCEYMRRMWTAWKYQINDDIETLKFALGSYNAGIGNILKAREYAVNKNWEYSDWSVVGGLCLRKFTGKNIEQTMNYVARILRIYRELQEEK